MSAFSFIQVPAPGGRIDATGDESLRTAALDGSRTVRPAEETGHALAHGMLLLEGSGSDSDDGVTEHCLLQRIPGMGDKHGVTRAFSWNGGREPGHVLAWTVPHRETWALDDSRAVPGVPALPWSPDAVKFHFRPARISFAASERMPAATSAWPSGSTTGARRIDASPFARSSLSFAAMDLSTPGELFDRDEDLLPSV